MSGGVGGLLSDGESYPDLGFVRAASGRKTRSAGLVRDARQRTLRRLAISAKPSTMFALLMWTPLFIPRT